MQSKVKSVFIIVLSGNQEEQNAILEATSNHNVKIAFVSNAHELRDTIMEEPCSGILLFIASLIGMNETEKNFIQTLEQVYPLARIRWHKTHQSFALIGARSDRLNSLADFYRISSSFSPRKLRRNERLSKTLNVLLSKTKDFSHSQRTFTINISIRGCFIHSALEWNMGEPLFLKIQELPDNITLPGKVTRYVPWGVPFNVQGIGIQFINLDHSQSEALQHLLYYTPIGNSS
jgi:Tfp pilus assembly protein PilZ